MQAANGLQLKIEDLASDDEPLFHLPGPVAAFEPQTDDPHDALLAIVSEISADTHRAISRTSCGRSASTSSGG